MAEVGQIPTRLIADMMYIQTKGQRKLLGIGLNDVRKVGFLGWVAERVVCLF